MSEATSLHPHMPLGEGDINFTLSFPNFCLKNNKQYKQYKHQIAIYTDSKTTMILDIFVL